MERVFWSLAFSCAVLLCTEQHMIMYISLFFCFVLFFLCFVRLILTNVSLLLILGLDATDRSVGGWQL